MVEEQRRFVYSDYGSSGSSVLSIKDKNRSLFEDVRKDKRQEVFQTKRFRSGNELDAGNSSDDYSTCKVQATSKLLNKKNASTHEHLKYLRNAFAQSNNFIQAFLEVDNALFSLVGYLTGNDTTLQLEAAWCITNITANNYENMMVVVKATSAYLITFLKGGSILLQDQSAWALGNMAAESAEVREMLKMQGIIEPLVQLVESDADGVVQSALFAICNLCKSQDLFVPEFVASKLPSLMFKKFSSYDTDLNIVGEVAWVLTHFTYKDIYVRFLMDNNLLVCVTEWICKVRPHQQDYLFVLTPLLRCLGNLLSNESCKCIGDVLNGDRKLLLPTLNSLLASNRRYLIKECLWVLSNIFAADLNSVDVQFDQDILLVLASVTKHLSSAYEIKKEAAVCLCNVMSQNNVKFLPPCTSRTAIASVIEFFKISDMEIMWLALRYFDLLLAQTSDGYQNFLQCDGPSYLEALEFHENTHIRNKAVELLEVYYEKDEETINDENVQEQSIAT